MRTIAHLSDLHFGRVDLATLLPLARFVNRAKPDLVAISGDLTQRARRSEFEQARAFLDSLPAPHIVVPGNHDIPLYNVYARFASPLVRFRRYIAEDFEPVYYDGELAVIGVNTARSLTIQGGRVNATQVVRLREWLCEFGAGVTKIVVTHHPFELAPGQSERLLLGKARSLMRRVADCGADLFLSGHLHLGFVGLSAVRYRIPGLSALIVQAGSATSSRLRGEANSFNILRIDHPEIEIERIAWDAPAGQFRLSRTVRFRRQAHGWERLGDNTIHG